MNLSHGEVQDEVMESEFKDAEELLRYIFEQLPKEPGCPNRVILPTGPKTIIGLGRTIARYDLKEVADYMDASK